MAGSTAGPSRPVFVVARNPDPGSALPYLLRLPVSGEGDVLFKARDTWPRTAAVYCHPLPSEEWPDAPEVVESVAVRSCVRRGKAIDLVLDRGRENRSQLVQAVLRGRDVVFWQTPRTTKRAKPAVRVPTRRASFLTDLVILVDSRERYPYRFASQQTRTERRALPAGDYGVARPGGEVVAVVERKSLADLAGSLVDGSLAFVMGDLAALPHAAVVVEDRYSAALKHERVKAGFLAELLAGLAVRYPSVPVHFLETRPLAEEWTFRFLGAALADAIGRTPPLDAGAPAMPSAEGPTP